MFKNFITSAGDKLYDGDKEFRFISVNMPDLFYIEDPYYHLPEKCEIEDGILSAIQMGGRVIRSYVFSVKSRFFGINDERHILAPGVFNEEMFRIVDKVLELCGKYGMRIIIPFVDEWRWHGGISEYCDFRGLEYIDEQKHRGSKGNPFWTDMGVREDFKRTISYVLNRVNTYTGIPYKEDKSILAWETGNELISTADWDKDITAFIKSIDKNHLVINGTDTLFDEALTDPNTDIVTKHFYGSNFAKRSSEYREKARGVKPYFVGEFGIQSSNEFEALLNQVLSDGTSGALIWSLRFHSKTGGFYEHTEYENNGILYKAYHWPGFPQNEGYSEKSVMKLIQAKAFEIQNLPVPMPEILNAPILLPIEDRKIINWMGSVGAESYDVLRRKLDADLWETIGEDISDGYCANDAHPLFSDNTADPECSYQYCIIAKNGILSMQSNVVSSNSGC